MTTVATQVAFNSASEPFFASGETGADFLEVAQQVLFAQQPGLHAFCAGASERMQVRAERCSGAIVSAAIVASENAILLIINKPVAYRTTRVDSLPLSKIALCGNVSPMKLRARMLLAVLAVSLASLTPVLPSGPVPAVQQKAHCCIAMNMTAGIRCPINPGGTTSSSATCCTAPTACLFLYFGNGDSFAAQKQMIRAISMSDDRATARSKRPPVPPPRTAVS